MIVPKGMLSDVRTSAEVRATVEAQPRMEPGTFGFWEVWGATPQDIQGGDYVLVKMRDGSVDEFFVQDTFVAKNVARKGVVVDGERMTLGLLCPIVILREGTRGVLSPTAR